MVLEDSNVIRRLGKEARRAASSLVQAPDDAIDSALRVLSDRILSSIADILAVNRDDVSAAVARNSNAAMIDRMTLDESRIRAIADSVTAIRALENPCHNVLEEWTRPNGLRIRKISVPIGVLGMIYESRPNVTVDAAALALKSRNAIILRGGTECAATSRLFHTFIQEALIKAGLPPACVLMVPDQDRERVGQMLAASEFIDVMIPRGGKSLTARVMSEAKMPVFAHLDGNCHVYVHDKADLGMALSVVKNAKLRRTGICGAAESLLLDKNLDQNFAGNILSMLIENDVAIVGDEMVCALDDRVQAATDDDWSTEYLDKKISVKFVDGTTEAVDHINRYGSHHTDAILTQDDTAAEYFARNVDSAIVIRNASTQFADGGEFGFGAEIGIGTGKLHARGPVGVRQLTTFKYVVTGNGQIRPS